MNSPTIATPRKHLRIKHPHSTQINPLLLKVILSSQPTRTKPQHHMSSSPTSSIEDYQSIVAFLEDKVSALEAEVCELRDLLKRNAPKAIPKAVTELADGRATKETELEETALKDLKLLSVPSLKKLCKLHALKGYSKLTKAELIKLVESVLYRFAIPEFSVRSDHPPTLSDAVVLTHKEPLQVEMNHAHGGTFVASNPPVLQISPGVFLERRVEWNYDPSDWMYGHVISPQEVGLLQAMTTKEEAMEWFNAHPGFEDTSKRFEYEVTVNKTPVSDLLGELTDQLITESSYSLVYATSTNGEYSLNDLAKIIYHTHRSFTETNTHERVYAIECNTKTNKLTYSSNIVVHL
jgi:hypothetical protein